MDQPWDARFEEILGKALQGPGGPIAVTPELDLGSRGLTSLQIVQLLLELEAAFGVELPDELLDVGIFATAGSLWAALSAARAGAEDHDR